MADVEVALEGVSRTYPPLPGAAPHAALSDVTLRVSRGEVVALIGDGGMGANVSPFATAAVENIGVVWVVMNNCAFGTIAGLENQHYQHQFGTLFEKDGKPYSPDFAAIGEAYWISSAVISRASSCSAFSFPASRDKTFGFE